MGIHYICSKTSKTNLKNYVKIIGYLAGRPSLNSKCSRQFKHPSKKKKNKISPSQMQCSNFQQEKFHFDPHM